MTRGPEGPALYERPGVVRVADVFFDVRRTFVQTLPRPQYKERRRVGREGGRKS